MSKLGTYNLFTQAGDKYVTIGYTSNVNPAALKRPGLLLLPTGKRVGILLHPGRGFLSSVGCINPATKLAEAEDDIDFIDSRARAIAIIDDLIGFVRNVDRPLARARPVFMFIPKRDLRGIFRA